MRTLLDEVLGAFDRTDGDSLLDEVLCAFDGPETSAHGAKGRAALVGKQTNKQTSK